MNICGVVVHTRPERAEEIKQKLLKIPGVDVFGGEKEGKLVVTVEEQEKKGLAERLVEINNINGVINAVMVYHQEADDETLEEEMAL